jgi:long-chain acyl-CoA synthetase
MNLVESLYNAVTMYPDKDCVLVKRNGAYEPITYANFWQAVLRLAYGLKACGIRKSEKVAILANSCPEWAISDYAILALGGVVVPIYPTVPGSQAGFILQNAEVSCLIVENEQQLQKVMPVWPKTLRLVIMMRTDMQEPRVQIEQFSHVLELGQERMQASEKMNTEMNTDALPHEDKIDFRSIPEETLATIVHTSGTSGQPKGVMLSHKNIYSNIQACQKIFPIQPSDVSLSFLPLSHILERTVGQFTLLASGAAIAYAEGIDTIQQNLLEVKPSVLITVPRMLEKVYANVQAQIQHAPSLVRSVLKRGLDGNAGLAFRLVDWMVYRKLRKGMGGRIRVIVSGGASLSSEIAHFYVRAGLPVHEGYGMTESSPVITANRFGANRPGTVGECIPGCEIRLAEDGELLVKGPNVMMGYYNAPEETGKVLLDGWLRTGDIAEIVDGYVRIIDRKKNILVLATGKNVAPQPIENAILTSPYISTAVVIGDGRKYVTCLLVPNFEGLQDVAWRSGLTQDPDEWVKHPAVQQAIAQEVVRTTQAFAAFERPKRAVLLRNQFSLETGELTPTLKVKNKMILEKFGIEIENMYKGIDYVPIFEESFSHPASSSEMPPVSPLA